MGTRINRIDEARGFTLISMILYHFCWDIKYLAGFNMNWYTGPFGYIWQKSICISFIIISGFCFSMGRKRLKRSLIIFFCGIIVSLVTIITMPQNRIIFGVLTFLGTAGLLLIPVNKIHSKLETILDKMTLNLTMVIGSFLLFVSFYNVNYGVLYFPFERILPKYLYKGYFATFLGFPDPTFFSTDYFAILPWIFIYLFGYYLERIIGDKIKALNNDIKFKSIAFTGRKSLLIYLLHQPVLYLITIILT